MRVLMNPDRVGKPVWEEMIFSCLAVHMSNFVSFRLHLWLRSGTCRSEKSGLWFVIVKDKLHEALRKREDRALCKTKYSCWAVKSTGRPHSQVYSLKLFVTSFLKNHEISNGERAHRQHGMERAAEVPDLVPGKLAPLRNAVQRHAETRACIPKAVKPCEHSGLHLHIKGEAPCRCSRAAPHYRDTPSPAKEVGPAGPAPARRPQQVLEANVVAKVVFPCSQE